MAVQARNIEKEQEMLSSLNSIMNYLEKQTQSNQEESPIMQRSLICGRKTYSTLPLNSVASPSKESKRKRLWGNFVKIFRKRRNKVKNMSQDLEQSFDGFSPQATNRRSVSEWTIDSCPMEGGSLGRQGLSRSHDSVFTQDARSEFYCSENPFKNVSHAPLNIGELKAAIRKRCVDADENLSTDYETSDLSRSFDESNVKSPNFSTSPMQSEAHFKSITKKSSQNHSFSDSSMLSFSSEYEEDSLYSHNSSKHSLNERLHVDNEPLAGSVTLNHTAAKHKISVRPKKTRARANYKQAQLKKSILPATPEINESLNENSTITFPPLSGSHTNMENLKKSDLDLKNLNLEDKYGKPTLHLSSEQTYAGQSTKNEDIVDGLDFSDEKSSIKSDVTYQLSNRNYCSPDLGVPLFQCANNRDFYRRNSNTKISGSDNKSYDSKNNFYEIRDNYAKRKSEKCQRKNSEPSKILLPSSPEKYKRSISVEGGLQSSRPFSNISPETHFKTGKQEEKAINLEKVSQHDHEIEYRNRPMHHEMEQTHFTRINPIFNANFNQFNNPLFIPQVNSNFPHTAVSYLSAPRLDSYHLAAGQCFNPSFDDKQPSSLDSCLIREDSQSFLSTSAPEWTEFKCRKPSVYVNEKYFEKAEPKASDVKIFSENKTKSSLQHGEEKLHYEKLSFKSDVVDAKQDLQNSDRDAVHENSSLLPQPLAMTATSNSVAPNLPNDPAEVYIHPNLAAVLNKSSKKNLETNNLLEIMPNSGSTLEGLQQHLMKRRYVSLSSSPNALSLKHKAPSNHTVEHKYIASKKHSTQTEDDISKSFYPLVSPNLCGLPLPKDIPTEGSRIKDATPPTVVKEGFKLSSLKSASQSFEPKNDLEKENRAEFLRIKLNSTDDYYIDSNIVYDTEKHRNKIMYSNDGFTNKNANQKRQTLPDEILCTSQKICESTPDKIRKSHDDPFYSPKIIIETLNLCSDADLADDVFEANNSVLHDSLRSVECINYDGNCDIEDKLENDIKTETSQELAQKQFETEITEKQKSSDFLNKFNDSSFDNENSYSDLVLRRPSVLDKDEVFDQNLPQKTEQPELFKVFARRSLKLSDLDKPEVMNKNEIKLVEKANTNEVRIGERGTTNEGDLVNVGKNISYCENVRKASSFKVKHNDADFNETYEKILRKNSLKESGPDNVKFNFIEKKCDKTITTEAQNDKLEDCSNSFLPDFQSSPSLIFDSRNVDLSKSSPKPSSLEKNLKSVNERMKIFNVKSSESDLAKRKLSSSKMLISDSEKCTDNIISPSLQKIEKKLITENKNDDSKPIFSRSYSVPSKSKELKSSKSATQNETLLQMTVSEHGFATLATLQTTKTSTHSPMVQSPPPKRGTPKLSDSKLSQNSSILSTSFDSSFSSNAASPECGDAASKKSAEKEDWRAIAKRRKQLRIKQTKTDDTHDNDKNADKSSRNSKVMEIANNFQKLQVA